MFVTLCKGKIHRARITGTNLDYEGSITIDSSLLTASGIMPHEKVQVVNINNGERFETYVIAGEPGSGDICLNGAAVRRAHIGDRVIIIAYAMVEPQKAENWTPKIVRVDDRNQIVESD